MSTTSSTGSAAAKPSGAGSAPVKELTIRGVLIGGVITLVFTAANVYLGLKVGLTFATSIPAAVISMAILRRFSDHTIQENNIVQTIASAARRTRWPSCPRTSPASPPGWAWCCSSPPCGTSTAAPARRVLATEAAGPSGSTSFFLRPSSLPPSLH